jgi:U3 small nucleolar ribonucleoprotein protein IMP4
LPYGPTAYFTLYNVVMRHDIENCGTMSEAYPHLVFNNFTSNLGKRCMDILKYIFPVPKDDSKRIVSFLNEDDYILFRHYVYKKSTEHKNDVELTEVGPRFDMKLYEIKLGTIDNADTADSEWKLRPYMNTAKKRQLLAKE